MKALLELFGKSPFRALQAHMQKAHACVERVGPLVTAVLDGDAATRDKLVAEICEFESEADVIKNEVRDHLPTSMFLPVDRRDILDLLQAQDAIADQAQDVAVTLSLRAMPLHADLRSPLTGLIAEVTKLSASAAEIIQELDELLETSFGGKEARKVLQMIDALDAAEAASDDTGIAVVRKLFALESEMKPLDVMLWFHLIRAIGDIGNAAEAVGHRLRVLLAK